jgi:hypothetical protein
MIKFTEVFPQLLVNCKNYKVHLATDSGDDNPLNAFFQDKFNEWQQRQNKKNFERDYIISFISLSAYEWLFAGIYKSINNDWLHDHYEYTTELLDINQDLIGRLIIHYKKEYRQSYPYLENCIESFEISQILKERYSLMEFPGYEKTIINFNDLKTIIAKEEPTWKNALKNVKGIYLISDKSNGKQYVGSAYGEKAFWKRWSEYAFSGHGWNQELIKLIEEKGIIHAQNFQFSILEIRNMITDDTEIIAREQHWKKVLLSQEFGHNKN